MISELILRHFEGYSVSITVVIISLCNVAKLKILCIFLLVYILVWASFYGSWSFQEVGKSQ